MKKEFVNNNWMALSAACGILNKIASAASSRLWGSKSLAHLLFLQSHCTFSLPGKYHEMPWGSRINYNLSFSDMLAESGSFTVNCSYWSSSSGMTNKLAIPSSLFFFVAYSGFRGLVVWLSDLWSWGCEFNSRCHHWCWGNNILRQDVNCCLPLSTQEYNWVPVRSGG